MGLKELFGFGGGGGGRKTKVDRLTKRVTNQYAQSPDRYAAMEDLIKLGAETWEKALKLPEGSEERKALETKAEDCYIALLKRFSMVASKTIEDEEEKGWLYRRLTAIGKPMLSPIRRYVVDAEGIAWSLRIVEDVAGEAEEWEILDVLLEAHPPGYERDNRAKRQMLMHLKEIDDPRVRDLLASYLGDPEEDIRFFCTEALIENAEPESLEPLIAHLASGEESLRLRRRILDGFADLGWDLSAHAAAVRQNLDEDHSFDGAKVHRT
ncbi:hypothetical protein PPSIR1_03053 [Plesiocystis pacifica SIR-1]|uniref:HEAT repeat domain-containing protein n=1 Tax=Plesiocystis pacifica SIR-1 TaxID=391625 RepID=A6G981_9BACT|nr:HEAT repeat domain-containing protein [Plesiocystis pacifica]EDM77629.1 hypothetical protein PPSIR1_03053 [Plesiocystis pacifica SIR-1]